MLPVLPFLLPLEGFRMLYVITAHNAEGTTSDLGCDWPRIKAERVGGRLCNNLDRRYERP